MGCSIPCPALQVRILTLKIWTTILLTAAIAGTGCASGGPAKPAAEPAGGPELSPPEQTSSKASTDEQFSKSQFIANDFLSVIVRLPNFVPGRSTYSAKLPRTRYGEILMEQLRQSGVNIVLGNSPELPALSYRVELPSDTAQNMHTFYVSVGKIHLKRSYEIVDDRVAPLTEMLMAGVDARNLRPLQNTRPSDNEIANGSGRLDSGAIVSATPPKPVIERTPLTISEAPPKHAFESDTDELNVIYLNGLLVEDEDWEPLQTNMFVTRESVYEPVFEDSSAEYNQLSKQILVFPNDSLVLGQKNKDYLQNLALKMRAGSDVVRVIGCSHGNTNLVEGNQKLARGRAVRVREELMLAGVEGAAVLHEACWAPEHFDEVMPRRGVVVMHLRERS